MQLHDPQNIPVCSHDTTSATLTGLFSGLLLAGLLFLALLGLLIFLSLLAAGLFTLSRRATVLSLSLLLLAIFLILLFLIWHVSLRIGLTGNIAGIVDTPQGTYLKDALTDQ